VTLSGRDAITVIFDHPAIALGQDWGSELPSDVVPFQLSGTTIPGTIRYVTTSIARFDPNIDWPNDLNFTLEFFPITGPLGEVLDATTTVGFRFVTESIQFYLSNIKSPKAKQLTDNTWSYNLPHLLEDGTFMLMFEAPPDSTIEINFSHDIDLGLVGPALQLVNSMDETLSFTYGACEVVSNDCLSLVPVGLSGEADVSYTITLPAGVRTSIYSGVTPFVSDESFSGLFAFRFPFTQTSKLTDSKLALYLRHGLKNGVDDLTALSSAITLTPALPFQLELPYPWMLTIKADFQPNSNYTLTILANSGVTDGFDLPLLPYTYQLTMEGTEFLILSPDQSNDIILFDGFPENTGWTIFTRNGDNSCDVPSYLATNIDVNNIAAAIASFASTTSSLMGGQSTTVVDNLEHEITFEPPFGTSGLWLNEEWFNCYGTGPNYKVTSFVQRSSLRMTLLYSPRDTYVWLTSNEGTEVISGATVSFWGYSDIYNPPTASSVSKITADGVTDDSGLAQFDFSTLPNYYKFHVVVTYQSSIMISNAFYGYAFDPNYKSNILSVITDRSFYAPGDTIYIKGYYRTKSQDNSVSIPVNPPSTTVNVQWNDFEYSSNVEYPVTCNEYGTFTASITVPLNCTNTWKQLSFRSLDYNFWTTASVLIATPRIPTVSLSLSSNKVICKPQTPLPLSIKLNTYLGTPVSSGEVNLEWTVVQEQPAYRYPNYYYGLDALYRFPIGTTTTQLYNGNVKVNVDADGLLDYKLQIDQPIEQGTSITIKASYLSPTKEEVTESLTLPISYSTVSLSLKPTVSGAIIPAYKFGVFANVQDISAQGKAVAGVTVEVNLYEWDGTTLPAIDSATGTISVSGNLVSNCNIQTLTASAHPGCTDPGLELPEIGNYLLVGTIVDGDSYIVSTVVPVGSNLTTWKSDPRSAQNTVEYSLDKPFYFPNDIATIELYNPFPASLMLLRWGNHPNSQTKLATLSQGLQYVSFNLGVECSFGCSLDIIHAAPAVVNMMMFTNNTVPTSVLFNPDAPVTSVAQLIVKIQIPPKNIDVQVVSEDIVEPGQESSITIHLQANGQPTSGDVAIFMVDKAVLDLKPNPISFFNETLNSYTYLTTYTVTDSNSDLVSLSSYYNSRDIIRRRLQASYWYKPGPWSLYPTSGLNPLDVSDDEYFAYYKSAATIFPVALPSPPWDQYSHWPGIINFAPEFASSDRAPPSGAPVTIGTDTKSGLPQTIRSNFKSTALFLGSVSVDATGQTTVDYTLPDNVGTYEIRAYAINQDSAFGVGVRDIISRKRLSLQASSPRVVRYGDKFTAGVTLTVTEPNFPYQITIKVFRTCELVALASSDQISTFVSSTSPQLFEFDFIAVGTGTGALIYSVTVDYPGLVETAQVVEDSILIIQEYAPQQEPVTIATSMAVSGTTPTSEGYILPAAVPFSGNLSITVGVGKLPGIQTLADMVSNKRIPTNPAADTLLTRMMIYIALSKYSSVLSQPFSADYTASLAILQSYIDSYYGLQLYPVSSYYRFTNIRLQAFGLLVAKEASLLNEISDPIGLTNLVGSCIDAMVNELVRQATLLESQGYKYNDYNTLAYVYLALGTTNPMPFSVTPANTITSVLSLKSLIAHKTDLSVDAKAALSLALLKDNVQDADASTMLTELLNSFRVQGRTAYISQIDNSYPNFLACSLGLEAYILKSETSPLIEKLANFVAQEEPRQTFWFLSGEQISHNMLALAQYDQWKQNTSPDLMITVNNASITLLQSHFTSPAQAPACTALYFETLASSNILDFQASGVGEGSVVFSASFIPVTLPSSTIDRGLVVTKIIQKVDPLTNKAVGQPITGASIGDLVVTTIQIIVRDYSDIIKIVDAFPGAFDPLDDRIYDLDTPSTSPSYLLWYWYSGAFSQKEYLKDKVVISGFNVYPGTYTVSYYSLVNTPGSFIVPPTIAFDSFQPELMGSSAASTFTTPGYDTSKSVQALPNSICLPWVDRQISDQIPPASEINIGMSKDHSMAIGLGVGIGLLVLGVATATAIVLYKKFSKKALSL